MRKAAGLRRLQPHRKWGYVSAMTDHASDSAPDAPTLSQLFLAFLAISLSGFGGTLPWAYRMVVEKRRWMSAAEFSEVFSLCQFLPGANVVNFSVVFGSRMRGVRGALISIFFLFAPLFGIVLGFGVHYAGFA